MNDFPMVAEALHTLDYVILGVILFSGLISLFRGFVREVMSLLTWVLAVWFVLYFSDVFVVYLTRYVHTEGLRLAISAMLVILITLLLGMVFSQLLMRVVRFSGLSGLDRFIGFFFGIARGVLITLLGLVLGQSAHMDRHDWWGDSVMVQQFKPAMAWAEEWLPNNMDKLTQLFYHPNPKTQRQILPAHLPTLVTSYDE
jgi:membrane protein required for colicin V production